MVANARQLAMVGMQGWDAVSAIDHVDRNAECDRSTVLYARRIREDYADTAVALVATNVLGLQAGGGTQHITQSIATIQKYAPPGKTAPDFKGAIGVTHDSVEGVDTCQAEALAKAGHRPGLLVLRDALPGRLVRHPGLPRDAVCPDGQGQ